MKNTLASVLLLAGVLLVGYGVVRAVGEFGALYAGVQNDPLGTPEVSEEERAGRMLRAAAIGALGVPLLGVGTVMIVTGRLKRRGGRERPGSLPRRGGPGDDDGGPRGG